MARKQARARQRTADGATRMSSPTAAAVAAATARGTAWSNSAVARCRADRSPTRQQQWTMRCDFDEARRRDGLLVENLSLKLLLVEWSIGK
ncbi:hypothetical protein Scep_009343 [Stephania cephalantha]|uniref:Uncharacterized protein n=1 Tax=Stephania cephalantha TaxID=152367 RepID=A0AAP0JT30_9MAGN